MGTLEGRSLGHRGRDCDSGELLRQRIAYYFSRMCGRRSPTTGISRSKSSITQTLEWKADNRTPWITNTPKSKGLSTHLLSSSCLMVVGLLFGIVDSLGWHFCSSESNYFQDGRETSHIKNDRRRVWFACIFPPKHRSKTHCKNFTQTLYFSHSRRLSNMT